ncbi:hypothetical protein FZEAL_8666 [Fusarium zealandicum]|uniref:Zn(2)-C6 fungal-type domain-containing protein n=1 Tax=Fusarium zealandicum TaxID=1053134 RepID=A0A8H4XGM6_9HYPO|nr:hypothetical protein FZEAL_8666 [Fusarium zealandicum]
MDIKSGANHVEHVDLETVETIHVTKSKVDVSGTVKLTEGTIVYIPTPTADPRDPLNMKMWQKATVLVVISLFSTIGLALVSGFGGLLGFYIPAYSAVGKGYADITHLMTYPSLFMGIGNLIGMPLGIAVGRRIVLLVATIIMIASAGLCAGAQSYEWHLAGRCVLGLAAGQSEALVPMITQEIFFLHERSRCLMIQQTIQTIATAVFVIFAGPIAGAISPEWWYGLGACLSGLSLILAFFFVPETKYERPQSSFQGVKQGPTAGSDDDKSLSLCTERPELDFVNFEPRTWRSDMRFWIGEPEWYKVTDILMQTFGLLLFPNVLWAMCLNGLTLGVNIAIGTTYGGIVTSPPYNWPQTSASYVNAGQIITSLVALPVFGFGSDKIIKFFAKKRDGIHEPEVRLIPLILPTIVGVFTAVLYGLAAANPTEYHWFIYVWAVAAYYFTFVGANIVAITYLLDSYPQRAGPLLVIICAFRGVISFGVSYGISPFIEGTGYAGSFGVFGALTGVFGLLGIPIFIWGKKIRRFTGRWSVDKDKNARAVDMQDDAACEDALNAILASPRPPRSKRGRLSLACNQCRKRKVRCDATTPKCKNCVSRGDECETSDPRRPNAPAVRRWPAKNPPGGAASIRRHSTVSDRSSPSSLTSAQMEQPDASQSVPNCRNPTWIERAYKQSQDTPQDGPSNDSPDVLVNTDDTSHRVKYMGASSLQCLCRFVDLCFEKKGLDTIGAYFRWGMSFTEEYAIPLTLQLPDLPPSPSLEPWTTVFFERIHPLIPVLDQASFMSDLHHFTALQEGSDNGLQGVITSAEAPALVAMYSVLTIGIDEHQGTISESATPYLTAAYSLISHLISFPYTASVQALLLLIVALRGRSKEGQAWNLLGQAIRISYSLGLHRNIASSQPGSELHPRLWWTCYNLEKMMELETGRPSSISDFDCDQVLPKIGKETLPKTKPGNSPYFVQWVSLSHITSQISEHIYRRKAASSYGLLSEIARLDQALVDWREGASDEFNRARNTGGTESEQLSAHLLSLQYYQAQITLLRASLIFPEKSFTEEINKHSSRLNDSSRMLQYQNICVEAARSTITQAAEFADGQPHCTLLTGTQPFLAAVTLALHTLRKPHKRMGRSDGELVRTASEYVADYYGRAGQHPEFIQGVLELPQRMNQVLSGDRPVMDQQGPRTSSLGFHDADPVQSDLALAPLYMEPMAFDPSEGFHDPFQDMPLDQFWSIMDGRSAYKYNPSSICVSSITAYPRVNNLVKWKAWEWQKTVCIKAGREWAAPLMEVDIPHIFREGADRDSVPLHFRVPQAQEDAPTKKWPVGLLLTGIDAYRPDFTAVCNGLISRGWAVILAEIPGTADSPADSADPESPGRLWSSVFNWMERDDRFDMGHVLCWGLSSGGYYAIRSAHTHKDRLLGVIAQGACCHYLYDRDWIEKSDRHEYPFKLSPAFAMKHGFEKVEEYKEGVQNRFSLLKLGVIQKPSTRLLLLNGTRDGLMPIEDSMMLFEYGSPTEARFFPGATHMGGPMALPTACAWMEEVMASK